MNNLPPPSPDQLRFEQAPTASTTNVGNIAVSSLDIEPSREPAIPRERLLAIMQGSTFNLDAYMPSLPSKIRDADPMQKTSIGFNSLNNHDYMKGFSEENGATLSWRLSSEGLDKLLSEGNSELVVSRGTGFTMGQLRADSAKPAEEAVVIDYQVLSGYEVRDEGNLSQSAKDNRGRFSNNKNAASQFFATIVLPKSDAKELINAVRDDPQLIREAVEIQMTEVMGLQGEWQDSKYCMRPPYESWHESTDGNDKMTLIDYVPSGSKTVSLLEFRAKY
jgi:hypothetical protein